MLVATYMDKCYNKQGNLAGEIQKMSDCHSRGEVLKRRKKNMKCSACGMELGAEEKVCPGCGNPVKAQEPDITREEQGESAFGDVMAETARNMPADVAVPESYIQPEESGEPPKSGKKKGIIIGVAAAAAAAAALAFGLMGRKDPKEVVIDAFENVYTDSQVKPLEELFGLSQFSENALTADVEDSVRLILEDCSDTDIKAFAGSGLRISAKSDKTNKKNSADIAVIYKDMELANLNAYYGDQVLMMAVPQLSSKVFTMDLGEGLAQRIEDSPLVGPALEATGMDVEGLFGYLQEQIEKQESEERAPFNFNSLMTRYREGSQAQEKLKEALAVQKGEKGTFTINGEETACSGYEVVVSKDSVIQFLRSTTDFFLNDEELKERFLTQLEQSVRMTELMGGTSAGISADQMYADSTEEMTKAVNERIDFLDKSLTDVNMTVYVDKSGHLAAIDGSTQLMIPDGTGGTQQDTMQVEFNCRLQGGSYLTQNMTAEVDLENDGNHLKLSMVKSGTYDGKQLTGDLALELSLDGEEKMNAGVSCTGTYNSDGGDYHMGMSVTEEGSLMADISISGVVDQLEKGTSIHADIDELKITAANAMVQVELAGDYSYGPLSDEVTAPDGEAFDVFAADETAWQSVMLEVYMKVMQLMAQLSQ